MDLLNIAIPLLLPIIIGMATAWRKLFTQEDVTIFNKFIFYIAGPLLIFAGTVTADKNQLSSLPQFTIANLAINFILIVTFFLILKPLKIPYEKKGSLLYTAIQGNEVFIGLPVVLAVLGQGALTYWLIRITILLTLVDACNYFLLGVIAKQKIGLKQIIINFVKIPIVIAAALGFIVLGLNITLPAVMTDAFQTVGSTITPLALFGLGIYIYHNRGISVDKYSLISTLTKLIIYPAICFVIAKFIFGLESTSLKTTVLLSAMPTALFAIVVADMFRLDKKQTVSSLVLSLVLSVVTISAWIMLLT